MNLVPTNQPNQPTIQPFLRFTASLGSVTDTLNYNWDCAYANEFPVAVEGLDGDKTRTIAKDAIGLMRGHNFARRLSGIRTQSGHV